MSFSSDVKEELSNHVSTARHCQIAELAAILNYCGQFGKVEEGRYSVGFQTENEAVVRKGFTLLQKTYNIVSGVDVNDEQMAHLLNKGGDPDQPVSQTIIKNACCQRAFLRGAFLAVGSISDPHKGYHLEFVCQREDKALLLQKLLHNFDIEAKIVMRKKYHVVYIKEGSSIVDFLNVCEAHLALMDLENLRILKEINNSVNRRVNCEAANITKTVTAATRQIDDIEYIRDHYGFQNLPEPLRQMAEVRMENPDASLKELGELLEPPVGRSGVNHRLRKLGELAERLRI